MDSRHIDLQKLFDLQKKFQHRVYGVDLPSKQYQLIPVQIAALVAELGEVMEGDQNWKPWRKVPVEPDDDHTLEEIVDAWHFLINITLMFGFDADDVYDKFIYKNEVNHKRQDEGY